MEVGDGGKDDGIGFYLVIGEVIGEGVIERLGFKVRV